MNSRTFCDEIIPEMFAQLREMLGDDFRVIHDSASFFKCERTRKFMDLHGYSRHFLSIPAYSPDMNVIENMFAILKQRVRQQTFEFGQKRESGLHSAGTRRVGLDLIGHNQKS